MDGVYIVAIIVIVCSVWLYISLKKRIDELGSPREVPPVNIYCTPQCVPQSQSVTMHGVQQPLVTVSPAPSSNEEMAAVVMAAIAAYESETDEIPSVAPFALDIAKAAPAHAHAAEKYKQGKRGGRWVSTARYENHKRL